MMTKYNAVALLGQTLESLSQTKEIQDIARGNVCVEAACALFSVLLHHVDNIKMTLLISELVHEATNETQAKALAHAYLEADGETLDIRGRNAVERFSAAFPDEGPDQNGFVKKFYRIEMDMSTEARRIAALQVIRQTCEELRSPLDPELCGAIAGLISLSLPRGNAPGPLH